MTLFVIAILLWFLPIGIGASFSEKKGGASWVLPLLLGWLGLLVVFFLPYTPEYIKEVNNK